MQRGFLKLILNVFDLLLKSLDPVTADCFLIIWAFSMRCSCMVLPRKRGIWRSRRLVQGGGDESIRVEGLVCQPQQDVWSVPNSRTVGCSSESPAVWCGRGPGFSVSMFNSMTSTDSAGLLHFLSRNLLFKSIEWVSFSCNTNLTDLPCWCRSEPQPVLTLLVFPSQIFCT